MSESAVVAWELDGIRMEGTVVRPAGDGPFAGVVMVAGSGPTDRDWCSPLLPGTNGSARLLAEAFADAGIASMRYDKRASGPHVMDNVAQLVGKLSMQSHVDELSAATRAFAAEPSVDPSRIVGLGNSEGTLQVLRYATSVQPIPFVGIVLAAPPGRPIRDVLMSQLALQAAQIPDGAELLPLVRAAADRYTAGRPMDPDPRLPDSVRQVLMSFEVPANLPLARELWSESATDRLPQVEIPTLVLIGGNDVQVDLHADGDPLQAAAAGSTNVTFAFPPRANHVLKHDPRTPPQVAASAGNEYNADGTTLDPEALAVILTWLRNCFAGCISTTG
ncbi:lysophospholipase [Kribbella sp. NBC_01505]|uniref:alpha/beta hydrolase family protein n=1 Tax=Kribbella sp. NBC_01505 TaxID=2903580 RepID=UPI00386BCA56